MFQTAKNNSCQHIFKLFWIPWGHVVSYRKPPTWMSLSRKFKWALLLQLHRFIRRYYSSVNLSDGILWQTAPMKSLICFERITWCALIMILLSPHNGADCSRWHGLRCQEKKREERGGKKRKTRPPPPPPPFDPSSLLPITPGAIPWLPLLTWIPMQQVPMGCGWFGGFFRDEDSGSGDRGVGGMRPLHCTAVNTVTRSLSGAPRHVCKC